MLSKGKWLFSFIMFLLLIFPYNVQSTDERGIKFTSNSDKFEKVWGNYHALIIGINDYKEWRSLKTAVKDAQVLKDVLIQQYGFDKKNVIFRKDGQATRERLIHDLRIKASNLNELDNLLIYFAGHGQLDDLTGDGYWIPVEGKLKSPSTWISHSTLKNILGSERIKGKNIVVVADSCYSGSLLRGGPSLLSLNEEKYQQKLAKVAALKSRQVISSGGVEPVADGGRDGHSLFAYYFLKALKENDREVVDLENLFHTRVWKPVTEIGDQRPNVGRLKTPMDEDGQFVLTNKALATAKALARENKRRGLQEEQIRFKQLSAEREQLEIELKRLKAEKQVLEKRKHIDVGKENSKEEDIKLASIPKSVSVASISLRKKGKKNLKQQEIKEMLMTFGFYDKSLNHRYTFENSYTDNGDKTITNIRTGLMWQKGGSSSRILMYEAKTYITRLNKNKFAGHSNWRLPTIEELASLMDSKSVNGVHIDSIFDNKQKRCWSNDGVELAINTYDKVAAWIADFDSGAIKKAVWYEFHGSAWQYWYEIMPDNYVRAVRTIK
jgi:uncharacterized caspase-like protein